MCGYNRQNAFTDIPQIESEKPKDLILITDIDERPPSLRHPVRTFRTLGSLECREEIIYLFLFKITISDLDTTRKY